jgi:hypothetical protein
MGLVAVCAFALGRVAARWAFRRMVFKPVKNVVDELRRKVPRIAMPGWLAAPGLRWRRSTLRSKRATGAAEQTVATTVAAGELAGEREVSSVVTLDRIKAQLRPVAVDSDFDPRRLVENLASTPRRIERAVWPGGEVVGLRARILRTTRR